MNTNANLNASSRSVNLELVWKEFTGGSEFAFEQLHRHFYNDLYQYTQKIFQDQQHSYDALQDFFLKLWEKRAQLPQPTYISAYLFRSLRNQLLNSFRKIDLTFPGIDIQSPTIGIHFSPEDILIEKENSKELSEKIADALNQLPERQRDLIFLKFYIGFTNEQISEILETNTQSVANLSHRALQNLRSTLSDQEFILLFLTLASCFYRH